MNANNCAMRCLAGRRTSAGGMPNRQSSDPGWTTPARPNSRIRPRPTTNGGVMIGSTDNRRSRFAHIIRCRVRRAARTTGRAACERTPTRARKREFQATPQRCRGDATEAPDALAADARGHRIASSAPRPLGDLLRACQIVSTGRATKSSRSGRRTDATAQRRRTGRRGRSRAAGGRGRAASAATRGEHAAEAEPGLSRPPARQTPFEHSKAQPRADREPGRARPTMPAIASARRRQVPPGAGPAARCRPAPEGREPTGAPCRAPAPECGRLTTAGRRAATAAATASAVPGRSSRREAPSDEPRRGSARRGRDPAHSDGNRRARRSGQGGHRAGS